MKGRRTQQRPASPWNDKFPMPKSYDEAVRRRNECAGKVNDFEREVKKRGRIFTEDEISNANWRKKLAQKKHYESCLKKLDRWIAGVRTHTQEEPRQAASA